MAGRKTYLYGLGTGIIAGSLLLQLATVGESASGTLTDNELEAIAASKGYVLHYANESWVTRDELESKVREAEEQARSEAERDIRKEGGTGQKFVYAFTIAQGTELATAAKLLYELGLISDYNGFIMEMEERGLSGSIQAKHYRFDTVPDLEELIGALTGP